MSAIYGSVDLKNKTDFSSVAAAFKEDYSRYAVEHVDNIVTPNAFMGCAHQYFTPEARRDVLPLEDSDILFTADVVLDNRAELLPALGLPSDATDGAVILASYRKWGKDMVTHLQGVYSFAIYDRASNEVLLSNDRFAQHCLFYTVRDGKVYFSTLLYPLLRCSGLKFTKNERWLVDEISQIGPAMLTEERESAITDVVKVVAGTCVTVALNAEKALAEAAITTYYDPAKEYKLNRHITPKMSEQMIRDTMHNIMEYMLRSEDQIGTELSCGLDSSTVACNAAIKLASQGRTLNSYTSVPLKEAGLKEGGYLVFDESNGVKKIVEAYPNIHPTFVACEGRHFLAEADSIVAAWEMPCKSNQNAVWIDEIYRQAAKDGCKVMLTGATGNCTLSAGSIENSLYDNLKHWRFVKAYKSLGVAPKAGVPRKKYLKNLLNMVKDYKKWSKENHSYYEDKLTIPAVGEKYDVTKRMSEQNGHYSPFQDYKAMRKVIYLQNAFAQIGELETKDCIEYGILSRDPMRTDDMMKLCFSLPIECFSYDDYDRRLVRAGMEGIVPEYIRHDVQHRGRQSGDLFYRLGLVWDDVKADIKTALNAPETAKYLDQTKINDALSRLSKDNLEQNENDTLNIVNAYAFALYLRQLDRLIK